MRVFVTGATGFAGSYLVDRLAAEGHEVFGLVRPREMEARDADAWPFVPLSGDLLAADSLVTAVSQAQPDVIYHLAGQASVGLSWRRPAATLAVNAGGTANLLEAARAYGRPRIVAVTSAEIYGPRTPEEMPIRETLRPAPNNPYAISKVAASELLHLYAERYGLPVIEARPFNHVGPRQALGFVVPDFASQIAAVKLGQKPPHMRVGNLEAQRDFTDVRDVVRAYCFLAESGQAGETYLICSGRPVSIQHVLETLISIAQIEIEIERDPARMRPSDTPCLYGSYAKVEGDTGWRPEIGLEQSLADVLDDWLAHLADDA